MANKKTADKKTDNIKDDAYSAKIAPYLDDIRRYVAHGVTEGQLCVFYRVGKTAWAGYKKTHPELSETLLRAREVCKTELVNRAFQIAMGYEYEETTTVEYFDIDPETGEKKVTGGKTTTVKRHAKPNAGMAIFLLINRYPEDYYRDPQTYDLRKLALEQRANMGGGEDVEGV